MRPLGFTIMILNCEWRKKAYELINLFSDGDEKWQLLKKNYNSNWLILVKFLSFGGDFKQKLTDIGFALFKL